MHTLLRCEVSLISIMVVDAKLNDGPLALKLFRNMYLAGEEILVVAIIYRH